MDRHIIGGGKIKPPKQPRKKPATRCSACLHNKLPLINKDIVLGGTIAAVGEKFGLNKYVIHRHKKHITEDQKRRILAQSMREETMAEHREVAQVINDEKGEIAGGLRKCVKEVESILERAKKNEDDPLALASIKELRACLVDLAKLIGVLKQNLSVTVSLTDSSPEWLTLRAILVETFRDFPDAEKRFVELAKPLAITNGKQLRD